MVRNTTMCALFLVGVTTLGLSACSDSDSGKKSDGATGSPAPATSAASPTSASPSTSPSGSSSPGASAAPASVKNALKALDTADQDVPGGKSFDLEKETDASGNRVWDIKVASNGTDQYNLSVSEDGAKVVNKRQDMTPDDDVAKLKDVKVSAQEALRTVADRRQGEDLKSLEIDRDDAGTTVWQVNTVKPGARNATETILDAQTGKPLGDKTND
ncbi:PepSY domain-containing protein [Streptomyces sp. ISL-11]|uniref:PepSY domain-containing protein n=1 Tax=Streptomyces sp. ISL-11 TaxID=2819174 RepID=UPI001BE7D43F|nr:PepSY domain-containing protein [Streptomyces sp. ISL-11]MBT2385863.1 PepSY domain-containing protein [Streptomyces sp. ISL-11]